MLAHTMMPGRAACGLLPGRVSPLGSSIATASVHTPSEYGHHGQGGPFRNLQARIPIILLVPATPSLREASATLGIIDMTGKAVITSLNRAPYLTNPPTGPSGATQSA